MEIAVQHGTLPLLHDNLKHHAADVVPEAVFDELCEQRRRNVARNLRMTAELGQVMDVLATAGIAVLTFKGPTLAVLAYNHLGMRQFYDLDLLVRQQDFDTVIRILRQSGYCPMSALADDNLRQHVRNTGQIQLVGESGVLVELHSKLTREHFFFPLEFDDLWSRRQTVNVAGYELATFGNEDLFLYLAVHGAKHIWPCLGWIADCAHLMNSPAAMDWQVVTERASETRSETMLLLAASLVAELRLMDPPEWLATATRSDKIVNSLGRFVLERMFSDTAISRLSIAWYDYHLRDRRRDALRYLWYRTFVAHDTDWESINLPRPLSILYPLLRTPRLLRNELHRVGGFWGRKRQ